MGCDGEKEESFLLTVIKIQYQSRNEFASSVYLHQGGKEYEGRKEAVQDAINSLPYL